MFTSVEHLLSQNQNQYQYQYQYQYEEVDQYEVKVTSASCYFHAQPPRKIDRRHQKRVFSVDILLLLVRLKLSESGCVLPKAGFWINSSRETIQYMIVHAGKSPASANHSYSIEHIPESLLSKIMRKTRIIST